MYETAVAYREMTRLETFVIYMALDRLARKMDGSSEPLGGLTENHGRANAQHVQRV